MTSKDGPISIPPTLRIEELFVGLLAQDKALAELPLVEASDRDNLVPPLHCFVYCSNASPVLSFGQNYRADVTVAVVSNIDDQQHAVRKEWFTKVLRALSVREPPYEEADAKLLHWRITNIGEASESQQTADVVTLSVAATIAFRTG